MEAEKNKHRRIVFYKGYFQKFFVRQRQKVKDKIVWTFQLIEELPMLPETYFRKIRTTEGLYEIRIQQGSDIFRIFCFFDSGKLVVLANGFQKKTQKTPKQEIKKALQIKKSMKAKEDNLMSLEEFKDKHYGKLGTGKRDELEEGYESFKIGALIHEARLQRGLTQEELARKIGTTKSYISKIENDIKEVRFSTLKRIVEIGLGGKFDLSIKL